MLVSCGRPAAAAAAELNVAGSGGLAEDCWTSAGAGVSASLVALLYLT